MTSIGIVCTALVTVYLINLNRMAYEAGTTTGSTIRVQDMDVAPANHSHASQPSTDVQTVPSADSSDSSNTSHTSVTINGDTTEVDGTGSIDRHVLSDDGTSDVSISVHHSSQTTRGSVHSDGGDMD